MPNAKRPIDTEDHKREKQSRSAFTSVTGTVKKLLPIGLLIEVQGGTTGLVREREISWSTNKLATWRHTFTVGQAISVLPLPKQYGRQEYSIRLLENDPWFDIEERYRSGDWVVGTVTGVATFGAFIELERGVVGLLHKSQLPLWVDSSVEDLFWVGDVVKVTIIAIQPHKHRIRLSMVGLRANRWQESERASSPHNAVSQAPFQDRDAVQNNLHGRSPPATGTLAASSILVVEDDTVQREALSQWLRSAGQQVKAVGSAEEALTWLPTQAPDMVLTDVGLPGLNGIEATRQILVDSPDVCCVIMTDWSQADSYASELAQLQTQGVSFLIKPLLPTDLLEILVESQQSISHPDRHCRADAISTADLFQRDASSATPQPDTVRRNRSAGTYRLRKHLLRLAKATGGEKVVLFSLDERQRQIRIVEEIGRPSLNHEALPHLIHSPVRDVAEDKRSISIPRADEAQLYLNNLTPLLHFAAFTSQPLHVDLPLSYALFLFFAEPVSPDRLTLEYTKATALAMGAELEKMHFLEHWAEMQRVSLVGDLVRGLVHEVNHHLSPINFGLNLLHRRCKRLQRSLETKVESAQLEMGKATRTLEQLIQSVDALTRTARSFGQMTVLDAESMMRVDHLVESAVMLVSNTLTAPVRINYTQPEQIFVTHGKATHIQQVVVNVLLNAIQQIVALRPQTGGEVRISLSKSTHGGSHFIHIAIEDDGPGIHQQLWQRIFDLGYSTRANEGSGLGLFLARRLIESNGGAISVEASHVLWGTRMVIELPVHIA